MVLSAGSVGTPQILMLSGIGPKEELRDVGISSVVDLPDVGRNLQDQSILVLQWEANAETLSGFLNNPTEISAALAQYAENKTGFAAANEVVNTIGFLRLPHDSPLLENGDPAAGPHSPHFQFAFLVSSRTVHNLNFSTYGSFSFRIPSFQTIINLHLRRETGCLLRLLYNPQLQVFVLCSISYIASDSPQWDP